MNRRLVIIVAGALLVIGACLLLFVNGSTSDTLYLRNPNYDIRTALFDVYAQERATVVMLGNSLTQWVEWNELLGRADVANRGIGSDVTEGYLHRLDQVYRLTPKVCFIEGGINDLYADVPVDAVFENYTEIVRQLITHRITPVVQSTLFVSPKWRNAEAKNVEVSELNNRLRAWCGKQDVLYLDLNAVLSSGRMLRDEMTTDGVHLNAEGYRVWGKEVRKILQSLGV